MALGIGDVLFAALFPPVALEVFGRVAGVVALLLAIGAIGGVLLAGASGVFRTAFPVMIVLGPAMVVQHTWWRRRGRERTTAGGGADASQNARSDRVRQGCPSTQDCQEVGVSRHRRG